MRIGAINSKVTYSVTYSKCDRLPFRALTEQENVKRICLLSSNLSNLFSAIVRVVSTFHCMYNALYTAHNGLLRLHLRRCYHI
jgi:hypothetical protein